MGCLFQSTTDTEVINHLIARSNYSTVVDRVIDALGRVKGAYSLLLLTNEALLGVRDPMGVRPLVHRPARGCLDPDLRELRARHHRRALRARRRAGRDRHRRRQRPALDQALHQAAAPLLRVRAHLLRPPRFQGRGHRRLRCPQAHRHAARQGKPGRRPTWSCRCPIRACRRRSAMPHQSGLPFELGIIRNHYVGRTFIEPADNIRHLGVRLKHNANRAHIEGKRVILVDDSIVRGTTSMKIVEMVRSAGAREVHMRIAAPPTTDPCFYGIDTPERDKLLGPARRARRRRRRRSATCGATARASSGPTAPTARRPCAAPSGWSRTAARAR